MPTGPCFSKVRPVTPNPRSGRYEIERLSKARHGQAGHHPTESKRVPFRARRSTLSRTSATKIGKNRDVGFWKKLTATHAPPKAKAIASSTRHSHSREHKAPGGRTRHFEKAWLIFGRIALHLRPRASPRGLPAPDIIRRVPAKGRRMRPLALRRRQMAIVLAAYLRRIGPPIATSECFY